MRIRNEQTLISLSKACFNTSFRLFDDLGYDLIAH